MSPCFFSFTCPTPWTCASSSRVSGRPAAHLVAATTLGEQRTAPPENGSVVYVNTLSEIRVDYNTSVRTHDKGPGAQEDGRLTLTAGEQADLAGLRQSRKASMSRRCRPGACGGCLSKTNLWRALSRSSTAITEHSLSWKARRSPISVLPAPSKRPKPARKSVCARRRKGDFANQ